MAPRLVAIVGPLDGSTFLVGAGPLTIGRAPGNTVCIPDTSVSRNHCVVESAGDRVELHDLGSHNRTFVNDLPVSDHVLSHGDEVRIGGSTFLFFIDDNYPADEVRLPDKAPSIDRTVVLRREDALYLDPQKAVGPAVRNDRSARSLECLLEVATIISAERQLRALADRLLQVIAKAIPAQVVSILLPTRTDTDAEYMQFRRAQPTAETVSDRLPSTIIRRVVSEQVSISSNTVQGDTMSLGESIIGLHVQSVLAVPLVVRETAIGVIYAANHHGHREFDEHHLQVLTGIAGLASGALDAARHLQELEAQNTRLQAKINVASNIIGESAAILNVHKFIAKAAPHRFYRCWLLVKAVRARNWLRVQFIATARARADRLSPSTVPRLQTHFSKASYSDTKRARLRALSFRSGENWRRHTAGRSFWMRLENWLLCCRRSYCASFRSASSNASAVYDRSK